MSKLCFASKHQTDSTNIEGKLLVFLLTCILVLSLLPLVSPCGVVSILYTKTLSEIILATSLLRHSFRSGDADASPRAVQEKKQNLLLWCLTIYLCRPYSFDKMEGKEARFSVM